MDIIGSNTPTAAFRWDYELQAEDKAKLERLLHAVDEFAKIDKDMPLQMLRALLFVCIKEGVGPNELARQAGVSSTVMSRHLNDLGERNRYKEDGHDLVEQHISLEDRRFRTPHLTPKGIAFRNLLLRTMR
jgi:DNA-binding MarR family transcriptional regulator